MDEPIKPRSTESAQGYSARYMGADVTANPYPEKTPEHIEWLEGWMDADDAEPKKGSK